MQNNSNERMIHNYGTAGTLEYSRRTNLLEQSAFRYSLQDRDEPNLYRHLYDYEHVPKVAFNHRTVPMQTPS